MKGDSGDAVATASGEDDGASLGALAGPHAATERTTTATKPDLIDSSLSTTWLGGPNFAVEIHEEIPVQEVPTMPPRGVKSQKRKRQYEHIKRSESARGRSNKTAERIAAATTNKTRRKKGETKSARKKTTTRRKRSS
jgi:hypothetical protein